jgi:hypothetical protein
MSKVIFAIGAVAAPMLIAPLPSYASGGKTYKNTCQNTCQQKCEGRGLSGRSASVCTTNCEEKRRSQ